MSWSKAARFETQRELAFGSIGASYAVVGSTFYYPIRLLIVQNLTDATLQFSSNGTVDHFPLASGDKMVLDISTNDNSEVPWALPANQGIYCKTLGTPTSGSVYVSVLYSMTD